MTKSFTLAALATFLVFDIVHGQSVEWERQWFASGVGYARGVSADGAGSVYVTGVHFNDFVSSFVRKYDEAGNLLWHRESPNAADWTLGMSEWAEGFGVSADGLGSVYSVGLTEGELGGPHLGGQDAFVTKYNDDGTHQWTRQFGTAADDTAYAVSADQLGSVYVAGALNGSRSQPESALEDAFLNKYDAAGNLQWTAQFGDSNHSELSTGVSADGMGSVYMVGSKFVDGILPNVLSDAFLNKYDATGNLQWTAQFGETDQDERATGVAADGLGNVYVSLNAKGEDIPLQLGSLRKYNELGSLLWTYEPEQGSIAGVSADALGNVYISGSGEQLSPDTYVSKLNASGTLLWTVRFAQSGTDDDYLLHVSYGISADGLGNAYSAGQVDDFSGPINFDAFLAKISVPEPTSLVLILCSVFGIGLHRSR